VEASPRGDVFEGSLDLKLVVCGIAIEELQLGRKREVALCLPSS